MGARDNRFPLELKAQAVVSHPARVLGAGFDPLQRQYLLLPTCTRRTGDSLSSNQLKYLSRTFFLAAVDKWHHISVSICSFKIFILCMCAIVHVWWSQDNLQESDFFCTLGPRDLTQVSNVGKNSLYLIGHLASMRRVLCHPGWLQTQYIAEDELELLICLPLSSGC